MSAVKPPNVIWFLVDQMRGQAMGHRGDPNVHTPNLDNMAIEGVHFPNAVSGCPLCCPFRGSLMTSRYVHNHSVRLHQDRLDPATPLISDVFNENGYETLYLGKWHLAGFKEQERRTALQAVPREERGRFDTWIGYENNCSPNDCWVHGHDGDSDVDMYRLPGYETDCLTDLALEQIKARKHSDKPFFMVVSVIPPHGPYVAPEGNRHYQPQEITLRPNVPAAYEKSSRIDHAGYYAMIENIDQNLGRMMNTLRQEDMLDDTHVIFFSDHGDMVGSHGRGGKCVPYEESIRIPFLIGGGIPMNYDGQRMGAAPALMNHVDIAPTTLGLCGIDAPDWMEGFDYSHHRTGKRYDVWVKAEPDSAFLQLIGERETGYAWRSVVTRDGWKYACVENGEWQLFNLANDPYEQNNLAFHTSFRSKRSEMKALLKHWMEKTGDVFQVPGGDDA